jgi:hypothetical protein
MARIFIATLSTCFLLTCTAANAASPLACNAAIEAEGTATRVEGSDDFQKYNGHVPGDLARLRAISAWQGRVADLCPGYSAVWRRATNANVECDSGMGHDTCTATGTPRRKVLSWLLSH